jgi:hypothetical protein
MCAFGRFLTRGGIRNDKEEALMIQPVNYGKDTNLSFRAKREICRRILLFRIANNYLPQ